ncbi:hypothetical protein C8Q70DRAFT_714518 [Cubamyces menziesii]|nr:hypothetical protein C8Q70DRAFT_714518 [Cubamyces menziesii]
MKPPGVRGVDSYPLRPISPPRKRPASEVSLMPGYHLCVGRLRVVWAWLMAVRAPSQACSARERRTASADVATLTLTGVASLQIMMRDGCSRGYRDTYQSIAPIARCRFNRGAQISSATGLAPGYTPFRYPVVRSSCGERPLVTASIRNRRKNYVYLFRDWRILSTVPKLAMARRPTEGLPIRAVFAITSLFTHPTPSRYKTFQIRGTCDLPTSTLSPGTQDSPQSTEILVPPCQKQSERPRCLVSMAHISGMCAGALQLRPVDQPGTRKGSRVTCTASTAR